MRNPSLSSISPSLSFFIKEIPKRFENNSTLHSPTYHLHHCIGNWNIRRPAGTITPEITKVLFVNSHNNINVGEISFETMYESLFH